MEAVGPPAGCLGSGNTLQKHKKVPRSLGERKEKATCLGEAEVGESAPCFTFFENYMLTEGNQFSRRGNRQREREDGVTEAGR